MEEDDYKMLILIEADLQPPRLDGGDGGDDDGGDGGFVVEAEIAGVEEGYHGKGGSLLNLNGLEVGMAVEAVEVVAGGVGLGNIDLENLLG